MPSPKLTQTGDREEITLSDGDRLVCRHFPGQGPAVVYFFHGLGGDSLADYMQRSAKICQDLGYAVFLANHRGCGEGAGLAKGPYHSGRAEDLAEVIAHGRRRYPKKKHLAVGFSLSGNALLLLLSGRRGSTLPDAAVAVNAPISLQRAALNLRRGLNRIYDVRFLLHCLDQVRSRRRAGLLPKDFTFRLPYTLYDFDAAFTATAGGFGTRENYYSTCSTQSLLPDIRIPTVLITSEDDPLVSYQDYVGAPLGPQTRLHLEKHGGHMGYLSKEKTPLGTTRWLDYALHVYLQELERLCLNRGHE